MPNFRPAEDVDYSGKINGLSAASIVNASKTVTATIDYQAIIYDVAGNPSPSSINITASPTNIVSPYYIFYRNVGIGFASVQSKSTDNTLTAYTGIPPKNTAYQFRVDAYEGDTSPIISSDYITVYGLASGSDALTVIVQNEAHNIPADANGNVSPTDYAGSGTIINVFEGATELVYSSPATSAGTWSVSPVGTSISVGTLTDSGNFVTVGDHSNMISSTAKITYSITGKRLNNTPFSISRTQSFTKNNSGAPGVSGATTTIVYAYKRVSPAPTDNPGNVEYSFSPSPSITSPVNLANSWSKTIPSGSNPLYVTAATAYSTTNTDQILSTEWSTPVLLAQNGLDGLNTATVFLYQRTSSSIPPAVGNSPAIATYTFSSGAFSSPPTGWSPSIPSTGGDYLWAIQATAAQSSPTDFIAVGEWASPAKLISQNGAAGVSGATTTIVYAYKRVSPAPTDNPGNVEYSFSPSPSITSPVNLANSWSKTIPSGSNPLYVTAATAYSTTNTDQILSTEWSTPVLLAQNGLDGLSTATVFLYQKTSSSTPPPIGSTPTTATYTFSTGVLGSPPTGWSPGIPASGGDYLWATQATAISSSPTDIIAIGEWASPAKLIAQAGPVGASGKNIAQVYAYKRVSPAPTDNPGNVEYSFSPTATIVSPVTLANNWSKTIPSGTNPLYVTIATALSDTPTDQILSTEWSSPVLLTQNGLDGLNSATVFLYQRTTTSTAPAVGTTPATATYTFSSGVVTNEPSGWSSTIPISGGDYLWAIQATAAQNSPTDTIGIGEWASPARLISQNGTPGVSGNNITQVYAYKRVSSAPTDNPGNVEYSFSPTPSITSPVTLSNGWSKTIPTGTSPLYVTIASALSSTNTDQILSTEWSSPVLLSQSGLDGLNTATVLLYQRTTNSIVPAVGTSPANTIYTFASGNIASPPTGWTTSVPISGGDYLWAIQATAASNSPTDVINVGEWASPARLISQNGAAGAAGSNNAQVYAYKRVNIAPTDNPGNIEYTFSSSSITSPVTLSNGWSKTIPSGTSPLYVTVASALSTSLTDQISSGEWSSPVLLSGTDGTNGINGLNTATVFLYQRTGTSTAPAVGTTPATATYTFSSGDVANPPSGWSPQVPITGGAYLWAIQATAAQNSPTDTIGIGEWASPARLIAQDGTSGTSGANTAQIYAYKRVNVAPTDNPGTVDYSFSPTPSITTTLSNGWSKTIPTGTSPLYVTVATASSTTNTDQVLSTEWTSPVLLSQNGNDGTNGLNVATVLLYQRTGTSTAPAVGTTPATATYTFSTGAITNQPSAWSPEVPITGGAYLWAIQATAAQNSPTDFIPIGEWTSPARLIAQDGASSTSYWLTSSVAALAKNDANTFTPTSVTFSSFSQVGIAAASAYAGRFKIYENGSGTESYASSVNESSTVYTPTSGCTSIKAELYAAGGFTTKLDEQGVAVVNSASNAVVATLSNESHVFPASSTGAVSTYTNSGTEIRVYEGANLLTYNGLGTTAGTWTVSAVGTNITIPTLNNFTTYVSYNYTAGVASGTDTSTATFTITGKTSTGTSFSLTKTQKFSKSKSGTNGIDGIDGTDGATGPQGGPGFYFFKRSGTGTGTGTAGANLGPPSSGEVVSPELGYSAIVENSAATPSQTAWRYSPASTAWIQETSYLKTGVIAANAITTTQLAISSLKASPAGGVSGIFMDATNNRIDIYAAGVLRVRLGNLA